MDCYYAAPTGFDSFNHQLTVRRMLHNSRLSWSRTEKITLWGTQARLLLIAGQSLRRKQAACIEISRWIRPLQAKSPTASAGSILNGEGMRCVSPAHCSRWDAFCSVCVLLPRTLPHRSFGAPSAPCIRVLSEQHTRLLLEWPMYACSLSNPRRGEKTLRRGQMCWNNLSSVISRVGKKSHVHTRHFDPHNLLFQRDALG